MTDKNAVSLINLVFVAKLRNNAKKLGLPECNITSINQTYDALVDWYGVDLALHGKEFRSPEMLASINNNPRFSNLNLPSGTVYSSCLFQEPRVWATLQANPNILHDILTRLENVKSVDQTNQYRRVFPANVKFCEILRQLQFADYRFNVHYTRSLEAFAAIDITNKDLQELKVQTKVFHDFLMLINSDAIVLAKRPQPLFYHMISQVNKDCLKKVLLQFRPKPLELPLVPEFLVWLERMDGLQGLYEECFDKLAETFTLKDVPKYQCYPAMLQALSQRAGKEQEKKIFFQWWFRCKDELSANGMTDAIKAVIFKNAGVKDESEGAAWKPSALKELANGNNGRVISGQGPAGARAGMPPLPMQISKLEQASFNVMRAVKQTLLTDGHPMTTSFKRFEQLAALEKTIMTPHSPALSAACSPGHSNTHLGEPTTPTVFRFVATPASSATASPSSCAFSLDASTRSLSPWNDKTSQSPVVGRPVLLNKRPWLEGVNLHLPAAKKARTEAIQLSPTLSAPPTMC